MTERLKSKWLEAKAEESAARRQLDYAASMRRTAETEYAISLGAPRPGDFIFGRPCGSWKADSCGVVYDVFMYSDSEWWAKADRVNRKTGARSRGTFTISGRDGFVTGTTIKELNEKIDKEKA